MTNGYRKSIRSTKKRNAYGSKEPKIKLRFSFTILIINYENSAQVIEGQKVGIIKGLRFYI